MTFLQKTDLDGTAFTNNNTAGAQGISLRTGPGSALQAQIEQAGNGIYSYAGPLQPTHGAPSAANPQQFAQNANSELFRWNGAAWVLVGNGLILSASQITPLSLPDSVLVATSPIMVPRAGSVTFSANTQIFNSGNNANEVLVQARLNGAPLIEVLRLSMATGTISGHGNSASFVFSAAAGDVFDVAAYQSGSSTASYRGIVNIAYIR